MAEQYGVSGLYAFALPNGARLEEISGLVDAGKLQVVIEKQFALADAQAAYKLSQTSQARGKKIIMRVLPE